MRRCDVIVIGAGPAGAATARELARAGFEVTVFERGAVGRDNPCGEGVQKPGLAALARLGVLAEAVEQGSVFEAIVFEAGRRRLRMQLGGLAVRRTRLDRLVAVAAEQAGAQVLWEHSPHRLERSAGRWQVSCGDTWEAPWLVGADGAQSWVRRSLGVDQRAHGGRAAVVFHVPSECTPAAEVRAFGLAGGEVYTVPVGRGERRVVWLGPARRLRPGGRSDLVRALNGALAARGYACVEGAGWARAPLESRSAAAAGDGWVLVGDAAGQSDPAAGLGVAWALTLGIAAARAVANELAGRSAENCGAFARGSSRRLIHAVAFARSLRRLAHAPALWPAAARVLEHAPDLPQRLVESFFPRDTELMYAMPNLRPLFHGHP